MVKRINTEKSSTLRFLGDFRYNKKAENEDDVNVFMTPYQLKIAVLLGYEKINRINEKLNYDIGGCINPTFITNPYFQQSRIAFTKEVIHENTFIFGYNLSGFAGLEYRLNDMLSVSVEGTTSFVYEDIVGGKTDIIWAAPDGSNGGSYTKVFDKSNFDFLFKPVYFLNLNINLP